MNGAAASSWSTMPAPNALRFVELIDLHNLAAHRAVATAASRYDFWGVVFSGHEGLNIRLLAKSLGRKCCPARCDAER
jgi:hypothetical protein